jgi:hypothetical protein
MRTLNAFKLALALVVTSIMIAVALLLSPAQTQATMIEEINSPLVEMNDQVSRLVLRTQDLSRFSMQTP